MTKQINKKRARVNEEKKAGSNDSTESFHDEENSLILYLNDINRIPLLEKDEEEKIARLAADGNKAALDRLINSNLRFVVMVAKKYRGRGMPLEDLISEGNIGLVYAATHFDVERGFRFITYAVWWIRQTILKALNEKGRMIRLPISKNNEIIKILETMQKMNNDPNWNLDTEIRNTANHLNTTPDKIAELINISQNVISLDDPVSNNRNDLTVKDYVEDEYHKSPVEDAVNSLLRDELEDALNKLGEREAAILRSRFGLGGADSMTLQEIGDRFNLSREWIRQIEKRALGQLQHSSNLSRLESYIA